MNAARVELSSVWFAFEFQFCWGRHRLHYACSAIATVFGLSRAWVLILFGRHRLHCECGVCATVFGLIRVWASIVYAVTGFFTLKEKQVSPEIRARPIRQTIYSRGRGEKQRELYFKANLSGHP